MFNNFKIVILFFRKCYYGKYFIREVISYIHLKIISFFTATRFIRWSRLTYLKLKFLTLISIRIQGITIYTLQIAILSPLNWLNFGVSGNWYISLSFRHNSKSSMAFVECNLYINHLQLFQPVPSQISELR